MHTIKFVANHTGLSQHTIRAWERRYGALSPERTPTNRRLYSASDTEKLLLLQRAVHLGHSIGQIAGLSIPDLQSLLSEDRSPAPPEAQALPPASTTNASVYLDQCLDAVARLQAEALEDTLTRASALLGAASLIDHVVGPLLHSIGERWRAGEVRPAQEHMATAIVRTFLGRILYAFQPPAQAPRLIVTTPAGQLHELGALVAAVTAAADGWRVMYLGPNLPAEEIAGAARRSAARAIALSIVFPPDDARLEAEIAGLRRYVGPELPILVGGRAAGAYRSALDSIHAVHVPDMKQLRTELESLRSALPAA